jgi:hypothetical protein
MSVPTAVFPPIPHHLPHQPGLQPGENANRQSQAAPPPAAAYSPPCSPCRRSRPRHASRPTLLATAPNVCRVIWPTTCPLASSTPGTSPASSSQSGRSAGARAIITSSVETIVPPQVVSKATSPKTTGTSPAANAACTGMAVALLNPAAFAPHQRRRGQPQCRDTRRQQRLHHQPIQPDHGRVDLSKAVPLNAAVCTPCRVPYCAAATCPNEPPPCPISSGSPGRSANAAAISPATRANTAARTASMPVLSVSQRPT